MCVTYEHTVYCANKTFHEESTEFARQKQARRKKAKDAADLEPHDDYDVDANTCVGDALVLGIDLGTCDQRSPAPRPSGSDPDACVL